MDVIEKFGHYEIARGADGQLIELSRSSDEFVFLAFDAKIKRVVELHVLKSGDRLRPAEKRAVFDRITLAQELHKNSFIQVLQSGEDNDVVYYSASLSDGELLEDFILRRGSLTSATTFSLMLHLLDDLLALGVDSHLLAGIRLKQIQLGLLEDTFLHLRILDFGFLQQGELIANSDETLRRLVYECCQTLFLMLTGKPYAGDDCDRFPVLTGLPTGLRAVIRTSLANHENAPSSLERLRDDVRETLSSMTRDLGSRNMRKHLVATDTMLPKSTLREVLLHDLPLAQLVKGRLLIEGEEEQRRYPFTILAADARAESPVTVHLLPPKRIVASEHYDAVPLQMWRFTDEKHPNILRSLSVWESPDLTFLTEERGPGMPLSRLIAERVYLNPSEVLVIMRQVKKGIDQAVECGVDKLDLHPSNITLRLNGQPQAREMEKLLQKRLDAWPRFLVMLRPHMTMRSLYETLLVDSASGVLNDSVEFRNRSFVALATYLLSGEKQTTSQPVLPDSVPEELTHYLRGCYASSLHTGKSPSTAEFLASFEENAAIPDSEAEGIILPKRQSTSRAAVASSEPAESVGAVSDFDDDAASLPGPAAYVTKRNSKDTGLLDVPTIKERKSVSKGSIGLILWAVLVGFVLILAYSLLFGSSHTKAEEKKTGSAETVQKQQIKPITKEVTPENKGTKPVEIRRAVVPTREEKEELKRQQSSNESSIASERILINISAFNKIIPNASFLIQKSRLKALNFLHYEFAAFASGLMKCLDAKSLYYHQ